MPQGTEQVEAGVVVYNPPFSRSAIIALGVGATGSDLPRIVQRGVYGTRVHTIFHPDIYEFNARIISGKGFKRKAPIQLVNEFSGVDQDGDANPRKKRTEKGGGRQRAMKTRAKTRVKVFSGIKVDAVVLNEIGQAVLLHTADCPTLVGCDTARGIVVAGHAGRDSLVSLIQDGWQGRLVSNMVTALHKGKTEKADLVFFSCVGIGPEYFSHPTDHEKYGDVNLLRNRTIANEWGSDCFLGSDVDQGRLDLHLLIKRQLEMCGIPTENISSDAKLVDTYSSPNFHSRRARRRGPNGKSHNRILVVKTS